MTFKANKGHVNYFMALISKPLTVLWLGGVLFLIVVSLIPQAGLSEIESGFGKDKIARIVIFGLLAFYPAAFFPSIRMGLITSTSIAPLGFLLEVFQRYVPGRNFSPEDMIANNVGAVVGILLALAIRFFFRTGHSKQRFKASAPDTRFMAMEDEKPRENGLEDEVTKTPKKSWKSKLIIFSLLLVMGYIAWVIFLQNKPGPRLPTLTKPSPAKTATKEKAQKVTGPDHPIRNHPEPELILVPDAMEDSPPPFFETELRASPVESPPEKTSLIDPGEKDSHEPAIPPEIEIILEQDAELLAPAASTNPKFSLRLGAFLEKKNAEGLVINLKKKEYKPYIFEAIDAKNRTWYAVHLSDHENLDAATTAAAIFRDKEKTAIIITHKDSLKPVKDGLKK